MAKEMKRVGNTKKDKFMDIELKQEFDVELVKKEAKAQASSIQRGTFNWPVLYVRASRNLNKYLNHSFNSQYWEIYKKSFIEKRNHYEKITVGEQNQIEACQSSITIDTYIPVDINSSFTNLIPSDEGAKK